MQIFLSDDVTASIGSKDASITPLRSESPSPERWWEFLFIRESMLMACRETFGCGMMRIAGRGVSVAIAFALPYEVNSGCGFPQPVGSFC